nr:hypothetical protein [Tanacetum cinerariifolium]
MRAFIHEFRTTNELLFKERNNSLSELRFKVQGLLRVINNTPISNQKVKGVTTRGGKTMTQDVQDNDTNIHTKEPLVIDHDELVESNKVLTEDQPQKIDEPVVRPTSEMQMPPIPFPRRLRKEKKGSTEKVLGKPKATPHQFAFHRSTRSNAKICQVFERDDEVILDMDISIKKSPAEDDECYGVDDLDDAMNAEAQELLENDMTNSFLSKGLEKSTVNTAYPVTQKTAKPNKVEREQLYSASAHEMDEKKPELKILPRHLEYAYLHEDKYFPIIISSKLSEKEKMLLLAGIEVDRAKIDVIAKLPYPTNVKGRSGNISSRSEMPRNNIQNWSKKLDNALWAFITTYKTPTGCTPFRLVYGKACHLPTEVKHKAYWALKQCNMDLIAAAKNHFMELNKLMELRDRAYETPGSIRKELRDGTTLGFVGIRTSKWETSFKRCGASYTFDVGYKCCQEAQQAFETLQQAMTEAPVISLTYFNEDFFIETDALGYGIEHGDIAEIPSNDTYAYEDTKDFVNHVFYATDNESISDQEELIHDNKKYMAQVDEVRTSGRELTCDNSQVVDNSFDNNHESTDSD